MQKIKVMIKSKYKINIILGLFFLLIIIFYITIILFIKHDSGNFLELRSNYALNVQIFFHLIAIINLIIAVIFNFRNLKIIIGFFLIYFLTYLLINRLYEIITPW